MLQEVIDLQNGAVQQLVALTLKNNQKEITFKSPTGSGKTHMMADMMNRIIKADNNVIFLVSALSKGDLAKQNFEKFTEYSLNGSFPNLSSYLISSETSSEERLFVPTDFNVYILPRDLYKKGGKLMQGAMRAFLQNMTMSAWLGGKEKKIYLIKDESHIATNNLDEMDGYFDKVYNFSATPNLSRGQRPDVEITDEAAMNVNLIKRVDLIDDDSASVNDAINKFEEIREKYRNYLKVNPCLIIQISNKDKENAELNEIYSILSKSEHQSLKWMTIVNKESDCDTNDTFKAKKLPVSKWKDYAKMPLSTIDIIIFKMVITEGWDIPRACMLYQMRDSKSKQLDEQVMGRVRRNPRLLDFEKLSDEAKKLAMTCWVWGIAPKDKFKSYAVKLQGDQSIITNEVRIKTTQLKPLIKRAGFNIEEYLSDQQETTSPSSIFKLYRAYQSAELSVKQLCDNYSTSYNKWRKFTENIQNISKESQQYICNYEQSMEITKNNETGRKKDVSFAPESYFSESDYFTSIDNWAWKRADSREKYYFDSEAERDWVEILKDLSKDDNDEDQRVAKRIEVGKINPNAGTTNVLGELEPEFVQGSSKKVYLWGKNFLPNSQIKFEYYLGAVHSSYPDFVMKDAYNRIHIFEVKSVNVSSKMGIDNNIYKTKVNELKKAYKQASKITANIFYLPIQNEDEWTIFQYQNGSEAVLSQSQFESFIKDNPNKAS